MRSASAGGLRCLYWLQLLPDDTTARPPPAAPDGESRLAGGWDASAVVHVELHDEWYDTPARQGDRANLVGSFPTTPCATRTLTTSLLNMNVSLPMKRRKY